MSFDHRLAGIQTFEFIVPTHRNPSQDIRDELTAFARWQEETPPQPDEPSSWTTVYAVTAVAVTATAVTAAALTRR